jgi:hypothetical protein
VEQLLKPVTAGRQTGKLSASRNTCKIPPFHLASFISWWFGFHLP